MKKLIFIFTFVLVSALFVSVDEVESADKCVCTATAETPWCNLGLKITVSGNTKLGDLLNQNMKVESFKTGYANAVQCSPGMVKSQLLPLLFSTLDALNLKTTVNGTEVKVTENYTIDVSNIESCNFSFEGGYSLLGIDFPYKFACENGQANPASNPSTSGQCTCDVNIKDKAGKDTDCTVSGPIGLKLGEEASAQDVLDPEHFTACKNTIANIISKGGLSSDKKKLDSNTCGAMKGQDAQSEFEYSYQCTAKLDGAGGGTPGSGTDNTKYANKPLPISSIIPGPPPGYKGPMVECAFSGTCRNVNDVVKTAVNWGEKIFAFVGSLAFVMFVIGGFMIIISAGNADKVKKGRDVLVAAVVGLVISFSAYLLIKLVLDALDVQQGFRAVQHHQVEMVEHTVDHVFKT